MEKFNKRQKQLLLILLTAALVFSAVVFLIPFPKGRIFWIAYLAELLAVGLQIPIFKLAFDNAAELKSRVLGFPVFRVGGLYLCVQTLLSIVLFCLGSIVDKMPVWIALVPCILVLAAALVCSVTLDITRDEIEKIEYATQRDTRLMTDLRIRSAQLVNKPEDEALRKDLEKLAEAIRYSDPVSNPEIAESERKLEETYERLEQAVKDGDAALALTCCRDTKNALEDRNAACRYHK